LAAYVLPYEKSLKTADPNGRMELRITTFRKITHSIKTFITKAVNIKKFSGIILNIKALGKMALNITPLGTQHNNNI
jgi:hypothetical protein